MKNFLFIILTSLCLNLQALATETNEKNSPILKDLKSIKAKKIKVYGFNPILRPEQEITIIEFNDLSCKDCLVKAQNVYSFISDENKAKVRVVYKHVQQDNLDLVNSSALYGLLASEHDKFWQLKDELTLNFSDKNDDILNILTNFGLDRKEISKNLLVNSSEYYKQLDADNYYSAGFIKTETPVFYIDGYLIGEDIKLSDLNKYIEEKLEEIKSKDKTGYTIGKF